MVVYLLIPTSNHNTNPLTIKNNRLYIFWFLHQTTTVWLICKFSLRCISFDSYIKPQLKEGGVVKFASCISFDSYIKPQLRDVRKNFSLVVYLLIPTSNHNAITSHSVWLLLYIFWFLHQTTTLEKRLNIMISCISFDSYIKPQPYLPSTTNAVVVYLLIPTSNHNIQFLVWSPLEVVYLLIPTSNHNDSAIKHRYELLYIFWFLHQTTTLHKSTISSRMLYIFWFLHQTTTYNL